MVTYTGNFPSRPFRLEFSINLVRQSIEENWSEISWDLWVFRNSASTSWSNNRSTWAITLDDGQYNGSFTYDFRNTDRLQLSNGTKRIYHNGDGTKVFGAFASAQLDLMGRVDLGQGDFTLPPIPRSTYPTFSAGTVEAGQFIDINLPRASDTFVHTLEFILGNYRVAFARNVSTNYGYLIPLEVMNQIPNSTQGTATIKVYTYVGNEQGRFIGLTERSFTVQVPAAVVPDFASLTYTDVNTGVVNNVGALVQGLSRLTINVLGAKGVYGSSIIDSRIVVSGQTITGLTGTMPAPLATSGSVSISTTITDSRGRTRTKTSTISVMAYKPPVMSAVTAQRATASGVVNEDGSNIRVNIGAAVSSLIVAGAQKNTMGIRLKTRARGETAWVVKSSGLVSGVSYNSYMLLTGYDIQQAWEIQVEVFDYFATSVIMVTVATSNIFMHWDARIGLGIGKYRQKGMLDVRGDIYHRDGGIVQPSGMIVATAGLTSPDGWLICNGGTVSRTTYANLFAVLGTTYGVGDGSTTFNLPNLKGRTIVGVDSGQSEFDTRGETGGAKTHTLTIDEIPKNALWLSSPAYSPGVDGLIGTSGDYGARSLNGTQTAGHNNLQPYIALNYIIKT